MNTTPRTLYSCNRNQLVEVCTATCQDCARFHTFYTKQANGSYKPFHDMGHCSMKPCRGLTDMVPCIHYAGDCQHFVPSDPGAFKHLWLKAEA